jgi:hypothetical protein
MPDKLGMAPGGGQPPPHAPYTPMMARAMEK